MKFNNKAFTFVELIVSTVIIIVLTSIGFISYVDFISDSRDAQRKSDLSKVGSSLKIYKQKRGYYSPP
jgi:Tfp pilus assembly protein PilE